MDARLDRRQFLARMLLTAAGSAVAACSDDQGASQPPTTSTVPLGPGELPPSGLTRSPFTLGVGSGDPRPNSVILWTRLALDPVAPDGHGGMPERDLPVRWELAESDRFDTLVAAGDTMAARQYAHSVHVDAEGLEPDRWYHYRFRLAEHTSPTGRTRTAPADGAEVEQLRLAFASCQDFAAAHYAAHRAIAADDLDLVLFLGDYIYEDASTHDDDVRAVPGGRLRTLADYRNRYATYRGDPHLRAAHARCPWVVTWDDHEVENNYAGPIGGDTPPDEFAVQRAAAYQAYYEHQPLRLAPPSGSDWPIHRSLRWGRLADLFVLDGRQYRDDQPCGERGDVLVDRRECDLTSGDRSMLGQDQLAWLTNGLAEASGQWKVLAQQTVLSPLVVGDLLLNVDQWDGYPEARRRLLGHLANQQIRDVVVLTGDIHAAAAGVLRADADDRSSTPVAVELVCPSIASKSVVQLLDADPRLIDPSIFGLTYAEGTHRGYGRAVITPDEWRTEFVLVDDANHPDSSTGVAATLTTPAGEASLSLA